MSGPILRVASLDHVRCFVAVGRRMSITLAAEDLCLTQSAVSRQVLALEEALGVSLLKRGYRAISFTPEGEQLFRVADNAVQQIQDAFSSLTAQRERWPITITASIGVTALWLLPRLGDFQQQYPNIDIRLAADNKLLDMKAKGADLAIRYCSEKDAPKGALRLFGEAVIPVAHPSLRVGNLSATGVIQKQVLLEFDDPRRPWLQWGDRLKILGLDQNRPKATLHFNQYDQVIQAALVGQGIALGRLALIEPMLADGRLVALNEDLEEQPQGYAYWLIYSDSTENHDLQAVISWVKSEADKVKSLVDSSEHIDQSEDTKQTSS